MAEPATLTPVVEPEVAPTVYPKPGEDNAPKRRGRPPGTGGAQYRATRLKAPIQAGYERAGKMAMKYDPPLAVLLIAHAEGCATAWDEWAKTNKTVNKLLSWVVDLKNKGGVASAHLPFLLYFADRFHLLERVPWTGDLLVTYIESHVNELLEQAIAEGVLQPVEGEMVDAV